MNTLPAEVIADECSPPKYISVIVSLSIKLNRDVISEGVFLFVTELSPRRPPEFCPHVKTRPVEVMAEE